MNNGALIDALEAARRPEATSASITNVWISEAEHAEVEALARRAGVSLKALARTLIAWGLDEAEARTAGTEPLVAALEAAKVQRERPVPFNLGVSNAEAERLEQLAGKFGVPVAATARTLLAWAADVAELLVSRSEERQR